jgi:hypothetical protein
MLTKKSIYRIKEMYKDINLKKFYANILGATIHSQNLYKQADEIREHYILKKSAKCISTVIRYENIF